MPIIYKRSHRIVMKSSFIIALTRGSRFADVDLFLAFHNNSLLTKWPSIESNMLPFLPLAVWMMKGASCHLFVLVFFSSHPLPNYNILILHNKYLPRSSFHIIQWTNMYDIFNATSYFTAYSISKASCKHIYAFFLYFFSCLTLVVVDWTESWHCSITFSHPLFHQQWIHKDGIGTAEMFTLHHHHIMPVILQMESSLSSLHFSWTLFLPFLYSSKKLRLLLRSTQTKWNNVNVCRQIIIFVWSVFGGLLMSSRGFYRDHERQSACMHRIFPIDGVLLLLIMMIKCVLHYCIQQTIISTHKHILNIFIHLYIHIFICECNNPM